MGPTQVAALLGQAANSPQAERQGLFSQILDDLNNHAYSDPDDRIRDSKAFVDAMLSSALGIIDTRRFLQTLIQSLSTAPSSVQIGVGEYVKDVLQSRTASFEEQDAKVREVLAAGYENEEEWSSAAKALQGIHLDSTQRHVSDLDKVQTWIRIVRCYLEDDDTVAAEQALNKIKNSAAATPVLSDRPDLQLHYQLSQARILDSRRDFLNASTEYLNVSFSDAVAEDDRLHALSAAIRTAVLAPAGPPRNRMLGKLYKDERASETGDYGILEKMYLDRLLSPVEVEAFAGTLAPHQLAQTADGSTVLSRAVTEHNLLAASKLYVNISTAALGEILGLKDSSVDSAAEKAEDYASHMIEQGRLHAEIDQIDGVIYFQTVHGQASRGANYDLKTWDEGVQGLVEGVEEYAASIGESFPALLAQTAR